MPRLQQISLDNFRNIRSIRCEPIPQINIILGPNGAGKSSLLESLSVLAHGKSFRTHKYRNLIKEGESHFTVFGKICESEGSESSIPVGVQRYRSGEYKIKIENRNVVSSAALASKLPLILINANSFKLLEGSPKERRKFFDWLVFHVKHEFASLWKQVTKCIKQRNSLLRSGKIGYQEYEPWDREISRLSREIDILRAASCEDLSVHVAHLTKPEAGIADLRKDISIEYVSGWKDVERDGTYLQQLSEQFEKDLRYGYTTLGPHKADIKIKYGEHMANEVLSRGQLKILITSLYIAEARVLLGTSAGVNSPVIAIDDLPSELDESNQKLLGSWLDEMNCQIFVTGINDDFVKKTWHDLTSNMKVFHVKHGELCLNTNAQMQRVT